MPHSERRPQTSRILYEIAEGLATAGVAKVAKLPKLLLKLQDIPFLKHCPKLVEWVDDVAFQVGKLLNTKMCFVAGTPVHTAAGIKPIEEVTPQDLVLTRDPQQGVGETMALYRPVLQTVVTHPRELWHVRLRDEAGVEETLSTTATHPFRVADYGEFVWASQLVPGLNITLAGGRTAAVVELTEEVAAPGETFTTYNFEVAEFHTYHVGRLGVWVHNESFICELVKSKFDDLLKAGKSIPEALDSVLDIVDKKGLNPQQLAKHLDDIAEELAKHPGVGSKESAWDLIKNTSAAKKPGRFADVVDGVAPSRIPGGLSPEKFNEMSSVLRSRLKTATQYGALGDDLFVQGGRAAGKTTGAIDIGIRVSKEKFDELIEA